MFPETFTRHSPRGECGLKLREDGLHAVRFSSLPARGVWIEMPAGSEATLSRLSSLPARGVWIEIYPSDQPADKQCHSPRGECGLKLIRRRRPREGQRSLPARGVWIEIFQIYDNLIEFTSLPARGVWIEIVARALAWALRPSLPARGVWIEIR